MSAEIKQGKKQWDTQTVTVSSGAGFGAPVTHELNKQLLSTIKGFGIHKVDENEEDLTYPMFKALVAWLHKNGYNPTSPKDAVEKLLADQKSLTLELQKILNSFVDTVDMKVPEDGVMGSRTMDLAANVLSNFRLPSSNILKEVNQLRNISQRVVRAKSGSSLSSLYIISNYFFVIDKGNDWRYELRETEEQAILVDPLNQEMIRINIRGANLKTSLSKFYPWFMLLNMEAEYNYTDYFSLAVYSTNNLNYQPLTKSPASLFIWEPDGFVSRSDAYDHLRLWIQKKDPSMEFDLVCVFFFRDFSFAYQKTHDTTPNPVYIQTDPEHIFYNAALNAIPNENVLPLQYATFLKIFAVKKNSVSEIEIDSSEKKTRPIPDIFYKLITLEKENLYATVTLGLDIPLYPDEIIDDTADQQQQKTEEKIKLTSKQLQEKVRQLLDEKPIIDPYDIQKNRWGGQYTRNGKTLSAKIKAKTGGRYPIELAFSVSDPQKDKIDNIAYIFPDNFNPRVSYVRVKNGRHSLSVGAEEAFTVGVYADDGTELELDLNRLIDVPDGFRYYVPEQSFLTQVRQEYLNRPITVPEDLQKNRWGGKSVVQEAELKAIVKKEKDNFSITVIVDVTKNADYMFVKASPTVTALFLHNSFREDILYEPIIEGIAVFELKATSAFTLGAYIDNGIDLELDLNELKDLPRGFYNEPVSDTFDKQVYNVINIPEMRSEQRLKEMKLGYEMTAEFFKHSLHGVTLHLFVRSVPEIKNQDVAFFFAHHFPQPLIYEKMVDGEARITIEASEAFRIEAVTRDGGWVSIDLNNVAGFPANFYTSKEKQEEEQAQDLPYYVRTGIKEYKNAPENLLRPIDNYFRILNGTEVKELTITRYNQTTAEIQHFLNDATAANTTVRAVGSGWSYSDAPVTEGWMLDTSDLTMLFTLKESMVHTKNVIKPDYMLFTQCGCTLEQINNVLMERKQAMKTFTNSVGQTIAGAISTGSHGSTPDFGSIHDCVVGLHIITGPEKHIYLERASYPVVSSSFISALGTQLICDDQLFNAALVSFGTFGIIHGVMIECEPISLLRAFNRIVSLNSTFKDLMSSLDFSKTILHPFDKKRPFIFEVYINHIVNPNRAWAKILFKRPYEPNDKSIEMEAGSLGIDVNTQAIPDTMKDESGNLLKDQAGAGADLFNNTTVKKGIATAIGIPLESVRKAQEILTDLCNQQEKEFDIYFTYSYVKKSKALLAFTKFDNTCVIQINADDKPVNKDFFIKVWNALKENKIPFTYHWGKLNDITKQFLKSAYGSDLEQWLNARDILLNPESRKLFSSKKLIEWGLDIEQRPT
jgi:hypothetical protein